MKKPRKPFFGRPWAGSLGPILGTIIGGSGPLLNGLWLAASSIAENSAPGTVVGGILGLTAGSTVSLVDTAGSRFAISGTNLVAGATATNYEAATSHQITIRESKAGFPDRDTVLTITVTNVNEQPNLSALSLSNSAFIIGTPASGAINGATAGSSITASGLPAGLTINGVARTWAWDGTGSVSTPSFNLVETLADSANSPRTSPISVTISDVIPTPTPSAKPTLSPNFTALTATVGNAGIFGDGMELFVDNASQGAVTSPFSISANVGMFFSVNGTETGKTATGSDAFIVPRNTDYYVTDGSGLSVPTELQGLQGWSGLYWGGSSYPNFMKMNPDGSITQIAGDGGNQPRFQHDAATNNHWVELSDWWAPGMAFGDTSRTLFLRMADASNHIDVSWNASNLFINGAYAGNMDLTVYRTIRAEIDSANKLRVYGDGVQLGTTATVTGGPTASKVGFTGIVGATLTAASVNVGKFKTGTVPAVDFILASKTYTPPTALDPNASYNVQGTYSGSVAAVDLAIIQTVDNKQLEDWVLNVPTDGAGNFEVDITVRPASQGVDASYVVRQHGTPTNVRLLPIAGGIPYATPFLATKAGHQVGNVFSWGSQGWMLGDIGVLGRWAVWDQSLDGGAGNWADLTFDGSLKSAGKFRYVFAEMNGGGKIGFGQNTPYVLSYPSDFASWTVTVAFSTSMTNTSLNTAARTFTWTPNYNDADVIGALDFEAPVGVDFPMALFDHTMTIRRTAGGTGALDSAAVDDFKPGTILRLMKMTLAETVLHDDAAGPGGQRVYAREHPALHGQIWAETGTEPYHCIPVNANDTFVAWNAAQLKTTVPAGVPIIPELGNEVGNQGYSAERKWLGWKAGTLGMISGVSAGTIKDNTWENPFTDPPGTLRIALNPGDICYSLDSAWSETFVRCETGASIGDVVPTASDSQFTVLQRDYETIDRARRLFHIKRAAEVIAIFKAEFGARNEILGNYAFFESDNVSDLLLLMTSGPTGSEYIKSFALMGQSHYASLRYNMASSPPSWLANWATDLPGLKSGYSTAIRAAHAEVVDRVDDRYKEIYAGLREYGLTDAEVPKYITYEGGDDLLLDGAPSGFRAALDAYYTSAQAYTDTMDFLTDLHSRGWYGVVHFNLSDGAQNNNSTYWNWQRWVGAHNDPDATVDQRFKAFLDHAATLP